MPRTQRGGVRQGTPGKTYTNRTDLNQPVMTPPAQEYGQGEQMQAAQQAVPLPNNAGQLAALAQSAQQTQQQPSPVAGPATGPQPQQPQPGPFPGDLGGFHRPSEWPNTPVTDGAATGPGAGPEALIGGPKPDLARTIAQIGEMSGNASIMALAQRAQGGS